MITGKAKIAGVMGWPVDHSKSPKLQNYWLSQYDIDGAYIPLPVDPQQLGTAVEGLKSLGFQGCNVTVPHKEKIMPFMDELSARAQKIGAVNTVIVQEDGRLKGDNTDGFGYMAHLHQSVPSWTASSGPVMVIGAGGAARAIIVALIEAGVPEIRLINRTESRAVGLAESLEGPITVIPWAEKDANLADVTLLTNTTTLGMKGQSALEIDLTLLPQTAVVYDIVYVPLVTDLLRQAQEKGCQTVDGLGMLLHQARPGFKAWFGEDPEVTAALHSYILSTDS